MLNKLKGSRRMASVGNVVKLGCDDGWYNYKCNKNHWVKKKKNAFGGRFWIQGISIQDGVTWCWHHKARLKFYFRKYFLKAHTVKARCGNGLNYIPPLDALNKWWIESKGKGLVSPVPLKDMSSCHHLPKKQPTGCPVWLLAAEHMNWTQIPSGVLVLFFLNHLPFP